METQDPINEHKHISDDSSAKEGFLTEKQCRVIEYHHAVNCSSGFSNEGSHLETENPENVRHLRDSMLKEQIDNLKSEALAILNRKWEDITDADYHKAIELLYSIDAYPELIDTYRNWVYIKGANGWKVKRSDLYEALRLEEEATRKDNNVTLRDWADLYQTDHDSEIVPEKSKTGILESFYNQGSGLAALILGDICFEGSLWPLSDIFNDSLFKESRQQSLVIMIAGLKDALCYYKEAAERGYATGYMAQALIYHIFGETETADKLEQEYNAAPYRCKRASYNLLRDYKQILEDEQNLALKYNDLKEDDEDDEYDEDEEQCHDWVRLLPLSLLALDKDEAIKYIDSIFKNVKPELLRLL